jgi:hypothetical protein
VIPRSTSAFAIFQSSDIKAADPDGARKAAEGNQAQVRQRAEEEG